MCGERRGRRAEYSLRERGLPLAREGDEVEGGIVTRWARRLFPGSVNLVSCFIIARSRNLLPTLVIAQSR